MLSKDSDKKIFLVDAMALIYRSYFAFVRNPLINSKGVNISASYGFTNSLLDVLKNEKPSHIVVAFDTKAPTERHIQYKEYKAQRQETPEDIISNLPFIDEIIKGLNIQSIKLDGYEADDIIGTLACQLSNNNFDVYILSADKDYGQLLNDHVFLYKPARAGGEPEVMDVKKVCEKWQISKPEQVIDILGLMGDTSDNIPGVPGVGEKTAIQLLSQFHNIENIYTKIDEVKGKLKEKLIEHKAQALLSRQLATIITNVPINYSIEEFEVKPINKSHLLETFKELEFKRLAVQIMDWDKKTQDKKNTTQPNLFDTNTPDIPEEKIEESAQHLYNNSENTPHSYELINSIQDTAFKKLLDELKQHNTFSFDTETTNINPMRAEMVGMSFSVQPHHAYYINLHENPEAEKIINEINSILSQQTKILIGQNIKYDAHILLNENINIQCKLFDTMVAHFLLNPDDNKHNMNYLSEKYLNYSPIQIETLIGAKKEGQLSMAVVDTAKIKEYAAEDADVTLQLKNIFHTDLQKQNLYKIFQDIEMPLIPVLLEMERNGVKLDVEFLSDLSIKITQQLQHIESKIYQTAGTHFNIASPKQVGEILFDRLKIDDSPKKTKTGQYATSEDILQKLKHKHTIVEDILDFRELAKLKTTYVDALPKLINHKTQRLHTTFNQTIAATGRLSSDNPNLQNIPIRSELGQQVRKSFIAKDEYHVLLSADYSQIELRIVASLSEDDTMINAFKHDKDIHRATAAKIFNIADEAQVTKEMRHKAKSVNFGIIYEQGPFGLAENLNISRTEAKNLIQNYFEKYPAIQQLMKSLIDTTKEKGYTETLLGRKRWVPDIYSANANVRANAERIAINTPIQGTAADLIKIAMINIHKRMAEEKLQSKILLQIHDELLFEVPKDEIEILSKITQHEMENAWQLKVPLRVNIGIGNNWLDAH